MKPKKHKVPFKVRLYRLKNTGPLSVVDRIVNLFSPSKRYKGRPSRLLFNRTDKIGDAMVTLPVLRDLKLNYPDLEISVLCSGFNSFLFEGLDFIHKTHIYDPLRADEAEANLKTEKYDAAIDIVGTDRDLIRMLKRSVPFVAGSRLFWFSWLYDYYLRTNWVSEYDDEPMTKKIEFLLADCFGLEFTKRNSILPFKVSNLKEPELKYDILFHIGTGELRKLDRSAEETLLELLKNKKVLITDGGETERFTRYKKKFSSVENFTFKLYDSLQSLVPDVIDSRVVLCYDGGQAHFLGQYKKCITLVGSVLLKQWAPYDFSNYTLYKKWENNVEAYVSKGKMEHFALNFPIWCQPCFGVGCNTRPCINNILPEQIIEIVEKCAGK